ncbi:MAG: xanthine dehydrogenase family protein subunit M [Gemmatimonadetes bacterium]|nr:xanthine dehydrogenase family protein subunit M [Gemmatimonadota bacterium]
MKAFKNWNARSIAMAVDLARQARADGQSVSFAGGGTDLLQLVKDHIPNRPGQGEPDVLVSLKGIDGPSRIEMTTGGGVTIGALATLTAVSESLVVRDRFNAIAEAAAVVATPQIRNVGTVGGNLAQRPWCWYFRNGFPCYKAGGDRCFSAGGENQLHAIFGGGPSYIVHPSDLAPALVAFGATFRIAGSGGERTVSAPDFFVPPRTDAQHENVLADDEVLVGVDVPAPAAGTRSTYHKIMDREAWTHALSSAAVVMQMDGDVCRRASIVLGGVAPIPWRVPEAEALLAGQRVTPELARRVGEVAVTGARPLAKNAYKVPLTRGVVERTVLALASRA